MCVELCPCSKARGCEERRRHDGTNPGMRALSQLAKSQTWAHWVSSMLESGPSQHHVENVGVEGGTEKEGKAISGGLHKKCTCSFLTHTLYSPHWMGHHPTLWLDRKRWPSTISRKPFMRTLPFVFTALPEWCREKAQDDGHQRETLDANIASTRASIVNEAAPEWTLFPQCPRTRSWQQRQPSARKGEGMQCWWTRWTRRSVPLPSTCGVTTTL